MLIIKKLWKLWNKGLPGKQRQTEDSSFPELTTGGKMSQWMDWFFGAPLQIKEPTRIIHRFAQRLLIKQQSPTVDSSRSSGNSSHSAPSPTSLRNCWILWMLWTSWKANISLSFHPGWKKFHVSFIFFLKKKSFIFGNWKRRIECWFWKAKRPAGIARIIPVGCLKFYKTICEYFKINYKKFSLGKLLLIGK